MSLVLSALNPESSWYCTRIVNELKTSNQWINRFIFIQNKLKVAMQTLLIWFRVALKSKLKNTFSKIPRVAETSAEIS